jgi:hypothetical protein
VTRTRSVTSVTVIAVAMTDQAINPMAGDVVMLAMLAVRDDV